MRRTESIASLTIAFNGEHSLPRQLDALRRQDRPLDEIIVVDNASSDSTVPMLRVRYPEATILSLAANTGVGGGYAAGLLYAVTQKKHDWVWLLDQDSVPHPDALQQLVKGLDRLEIPRKDVGIIASLAVHPETKTFYWGSVWHHGWHRTASDRDRPPISFVDAVISSGSLVRREAVNQAGLPRADFFMDFVDLEYCLRLRRLGYKIAIVKESVLDHAIGLPRRIRFLTTTLAWHDHAPWREYYKTRNEIFTIWNYDHKWTPKCSALYRLVRHAVGILLLGRSKRECLKMMYLGAMDGRSGKLGIRFPLQRG